MTDFLYILNSVLPLYLMIVAGILLRRLLRFGDKEASVLNRITFYSFLPCMLFRNALTADFSGITSAKPYIYAVIAFFLSGLICIVYGKKTIPDEKKAGAFCHSAIRKNTSLLGIPLAMRYLGEANALPSVLMTTVMLPCMNVYGILELTYFIREGKQGTAPFKRVLKGFVTSPLIIALALGFLCNFAHIRLPEFLLEALKGLSGAASPAAMVAIGMGFTFSGMKAEAGLVLKGTLVNVVLQPLFIIGGAVLLGFRGMELTVICLGFLLPCAANSSVISQSMGADGALSGEIVVTTTAASLVTIVGGLMLVKAFGLI